MQIHNIKNLIFDLGGVIIDLHIDRTVQAFCDLAKVDPEEVKGRYGKEPFFEDYETGRISDDQFRESLAQYLGIELEKGKIDEAWNAMLGNLPFHRVMRIDRLKAEYDVYLLSNTNKIHYDAYTRILRNSTGFESLDHLFRKAYYSHEINMRKPDEEIFVHVLEDSRLEPSETLFLDDTRENLLGAEKVGINTFHVTFPDQWLSLFNE